MWNTWRKAHTFNAAPLAEVEAILNAHLTPEERQEALNRPSAAATAAQQADPRKRAAPGVAAASPSASPSGSPSYGQEPSVKKAKLVDPRRPPVAAAPALSSDAAALDIILSSVDVQSRVPRELLERMRLQLRQPMAEADSKTLVVSLAHELQQAMNLQPAVAAVAPQPLPATLPPPLPIPAALPPLPAMPPQPFVPMQPAMPPIGMPLAPAPLPLPMQPHPFAGFPPPVSAPPTWNQSPPVQPPVQPPVHASPPAAMARAPARTEVCVTTRCNKIQQIMTLFLSLSVAVVATHAHRVSLVFFFSFSFFCIPWLCLFFFLSAPSPHHFLRRGSPNVSNNHKLSRRVASKFSRGGVCSRFFFSLLLLFFPLSSSRHSFLVPSLYEAIPFQCKTCGRRIHNSAEMTAHLDWHFKMHKRAATIAKTGGGVRSQNWYWDEAEWVAAEDVIFGVQKRAATSTAAANKAAGGAAGTAGGDDAAGAKPAPQSVPADEKHKKCSVSCAFNIQCHPTTLFNPLRSPVTHRRCCVAVAVAVICCCCCVS